MISYNYKPLEDFELSDVKQIAIIKICDLYQKDDELKSKKDSLSTMDKNYRLKLSSEKPYKT